MAKAATGDVFRVVVMREGDWWIAQCLEHDIATQAKTMNDAVRDFLRVLQAEVELRKKPGMQQLKDVPPAPRRFHDLYAQCLKMEFARSAEEAIPGWVPPAWMAKTFGAMQLGFCG